MIKQIFFLLSFVQIINASDAAKSVGESSVIVLQADQKSTAEPILDLKPNSVSPGSIASDASAQAQPKAVSEDSSKNLIYAIASGETTSEYTKTTKLTDFVTGEWMEETVLYDKAAEKAGTCYVKSVYHSLHIHSNENLYTFFANLSLMKEQMVWERLKDAKAPLTILHNQNYAPFAIKSE